MDHRFECESCIRYYSPSSTDLLGKGRVLFEPFPDLDGISAIPGALGDPGWITYALGRPEGS